MVAQVSKMIPARSVLIGRFRISVDWVVVVVVVRIVVVVVDVVVMSFLVAIHDIAPPPGRH